MAQEKAARSQAEQRSIALLTEKKNWEVSLHDRDERIAVLEKRVSELEECEADLKLELKVGVCMGIEIETVTKRSASTVAEVRAEMRNIQETCLQQIEQVQAEKEAEAAVWEKEKVRLGTEAEELQNTFVKQREALESENDKEKQRIINQYEKERTKLIADFEKQKKQLEAEKEGAVSNANKEEKTLTKKLKAEADAECAVKLSELKKQLEAAHQMNIQRLQAEQAAQLNQVQIAAQEQLNKLKEECVRRLEQQKKELESKQAAMPDLGFSAAVMMDPFAGITGTTPSSSPQPDAESSVNSFEDFGELGDFKSIPIPEVTVPEVTMPEVTVDTSALDSLRAVSVLLECDV